MKPVDIAGRILEWEENGKLVDDESWVQNNAPALAAAYMELYVWRDAFAYLVRTALGEAATASTREEQVFSGNPEKEQSPLSPTPAPVEEG